jgi:hypothetical protein
MTEQPTTPAKRLRYVCPNSGASLRCAECGCNAPHRYEAIGLEGYPPVCPTCRRALMPAGEVH